MTFLSQSNTHFQKELKQLLYAFGDNLVPRDDTSVLLEQILCEYILNLVFKALKNSQLSNSPVIIYTKLRLDDILFVLRHEDPKKAARASELLYMNTEIKKARKLDIENAEDKNLANIFGETSPSFFK